MKFALFASFGWLRVAGAIAAMVGSPEAKGLFIRAAAQSGAWMGLSIAKQKTMAEAEAQGKTAAGTHSIAELRAMSTADVSQNLRGVSTGMIVDGWIIPEDESITYAKGKQNDVDILVGSNRDEGTFFGGGNVTAEQAKTRAEVVATAIGTMTVTQGPHPWYVVRFPD